MRKILFIIIALIALTSGMREWQFNFGFHLCIYDVLSVFFVIAFVIYYLARPRGFALKHEMNLLLAILWVYYFIEVMSGFKVVFAFNSEDSFVQFHKGIISSGVFTIFATFFCIFISVIDREHRYKILLFYVSGVVLSSLYGLLGSFLYQSYGVRIESLFWDYLSYNTTGRYEEDLTWAVMGIRRGIGFPGYSAAATYNVTILPLLLLYVLYRGWLRDYLIFVVCFMGLAVTVSRTGIISFAVSLIPFFLICMRRVRSSLVALLILVFPFACASFFWWDYIVEIAKFRELSDITRAMQWESGLHLFFQNPFLGVGANNGSVARYTLGPEFFHDENFHSSWLTILVQLGIFGFVCYAAFLAFIIWRAFLKQGVLSMGLICAIIGLSVGALGNQLFDLFYFKFFIILVSTMVILGDGQFVNMKCSRSQKAVVFPK